MAYPEAEKFRSRALPNYQILHELCANLSATGEFALSTNLTFYSNFASESQASQSSLSQAPKGQPGALFPSQPISINPTDVETSYGDSIRRDTEQAYGESKEEEERDEGGLGQGSNCKRGGIKIKQEVVGVREQAEKTTKRDIEEVEAGRESEEEAEEEKTRLPVKKKAKVERKTAGHAIAQALDRLGGTAQSIQRSKAEIAVERIQTDYSSSLSVEDLVKAFIVMESEVKASIFIGLKAGQARDRWLQEAINNL